MPSKMALKLGAVGIGVALSGGALALVATPAQAAPSTPRPFYFNCTYPQVCLYNSTVDIVLRYQDYTSSFQGFTRTDVYYGLNTRNDDVAYIRYTNGDQACLPAANNMTIYNLRAFGTPNGIRISSSDTCDPNIPVPPVRK